ncbi:hypothetical protein ASZ90_005378 [hydrocarbon metagenome]|uniref:Uncharacterized protein n=1 Tax=hydrocarbon metagenome TaxID=938273 RepID=A0A0W8FVE0_9ZZZZ
METVKKKYIVDENNNRVAVQLDIDTFNRIEEVLENYGLVELMKEEELSEKLELKEAQEYYNKLSKEK